MAKAQGELQVKQATAQSDMQIEQAKLVLARCHHGLFLQNQTASAVNQMAEPELSAGVTTCNPYTAADAEANSSRMERGRAAQRSTNIRGPPRRASASTRRRCFQTKEPPFARPRETSRDLAKPRED